jgi:hypothetical protein
MIDREEFAQVRALAEVEGTCPKAAVRAFLRQEHRYYDIIGGYGKPTSVPLSVPLYIRTDEGKEKRAEQNRAWWREHGAEYRAKRKAEGRPCPGGRQYRARIT